jgi:threonyl-tRNA synthetase
VTDALRGAGIRAEFDDRSETLGFKIRDAEKQKIPLSLVVGEQEASSGTVAPRLRKSKEKIEPMSVDAIVSRLAISATERKMGPLS